ncbi:hypothetical protein MMPV_002632 [Pyropia vietnamensis]
MMATRTPLSPQALALSATLTGHTGAVWCVAWSPEGGLLASAGADASVRLWAPPPGVLDGGHRLADGGIDRDKGRRDGLDVEAAAEADGAEEAAAGWTCLFTVGSDVFPRTVRSVAWNPDGHSLAAACFDATVTILELLPGPPPSLVVAAVLEGHESEVKSVAWSSGGALLATASRDKSVWIWEVGGTSPDDVECVAVLTAHTADVKALAWHPAAELLASASYDDTVRVWAEDEDDWYATGVLSAHTSTVWGVAWERAGAARRLVTVSDDQTVVVYRRVPPLVAGGEDRWVVMWRLGAENPPRDGGDPVGVHRRPIYAVDWGRGGWIATACGDDCVRVFGPPRGTRPPPAVADEWASNSEADAPPPLPPGADAGAIPISSDAPPSKGQSAPPAGSAPPSVDTDDAPAADDGSAFVLVGVAAPAHAGDVNSVAWHPVDERVLASAGDDGAVRVWRLPCGG